MLEKRGCKIHYNVDNNGRENVTVEVKDGNNTLEVPWQQYLNDHVDDKLHKMMKDNVLLATRNFQHRVETFRKEVIFGRNNPMKVRHISYRVEFQGRGAAHIHGVLWLDLKELKVEGVHNSELQNAYIKLRQSQPLDAEEVRALERFTDTFVTCTRCVTVAGEEAVKIAEETNWHGHSNSCKKGGGRLCRWKFPRYPLARTIFVDANRDDEGEHKMEAKVRDEILDRVMRVLVEEKGGKMVLSRKVEKIMGKYPKVENISTAEGNILASEEEEESTELPFHPEITNLNPPSPILHPKATTQNSPSATIHTEDKNQNSPSPTFHPETSQDTYPDDPLTPIFFSDDPPYPALHPETSQDSYPVSPSSPDPFSDAPHSPVFPSQDTYPDCPSTPDPFSDDSSSPTFHSEPTTPNQPSPTIHTEITNQNPPNLHPVPNTTKAPESSEQAQLPPQKSTKKPNTVTYVKRESPEEYKVNIRKRIEEVLKKASAGGVPITYEMYETAVVQQPRKGSEVLLQRDIDEIFINNYNPEWIVDWNANIDISPVYDYYGTITYITDYFTKVSSTI